MRMNSPKISDDVVLKATGKTWQQWFAILDTAGAKDMKHVDIARFVHTNYLSKPDDEHDGINVATSGGWWSQSVTVEYERARGLRAVNQQADGFLVSISKTVPGSVELLQNKWNSVLKSEEVLQQKLILSTYV